MLKIIISSELLTYTFGFLHKPRQSQKDEKNKIKEKNKVKLKLHLGAFPSFTFF